MICMILYDTLIYPGSPAKIDYIRVYNRIIHNTRASPVDCSLLVSHNHNREKEVSSTPGKKHGIPRRLDGFSSLPSFLFFLFFPFSRLHFRVRLLSLLFLFSFPLTTSIITTTTVTTTTTTITTITITILSPDYVSALYRFSQFASASPDFCLAVTTFPCARPDCLAPTDHLLSHVTSSSGRESFTD